MNAAARFWSNVDVNGPVPAHAPDLGRCWIWTASRVSAGYGVISIKRRSRPAHRFSYEMLRGPIPAGHVIDHRCHVPACVNPTHLRPATPKQNMENQRGASSRSTTGIRGVSYSARTGKWCAEVRHDYETYAKRFDSAEEAEAWAIATRNALYSHNDSDRRLSADTADVEQKTPSPINVKCGEMVRVALESRGYDPIEYAERIGIGQPGMLRRLRGSTGFRCDELMLLARSLNIPPSELIPS